MLNIISNTQHSIKENLNNHVANLQRGEVLKVNEELFNEID